MEALSVGMCGSLWLSAVVHDQSFFNRGGGIVLQENIKLGLILAMSLIFDQTPLVSKDEKKYYMLYNFFICFSRKPLN